MTLRNGETGGDATFGGVRQLAFANDDRIYFRGSGDAVTSYGSWYEVWNSGNQGIDSGLDADKLDNKQGLWYQDAKNIISNTILILDFLYGEVLLSLETRLKSHLMVEQILSIEF